MAEVAEEDVIPDSLVSNNEGDESLMFSGDRDAHLFKEDD